MDSSHSYVARVIAAASVRQELRRWSGAGRCEAPSGPLPPGDRDPVSRDRAQALMDLACCKDLSFHRYLEEEGEIPRALLPSPRFAGRIKLDGRMNLNGVFGPNRRKYAVGVGAESTRLCGSEFRGYALKNQWPTRRPLWQRSGDRVGKPRMMGSAHETDKIAR